MLVFFKLDPNGNEQVSCGGTEIIASDPGGDGFASCSASSNLPGYECEAGLSNKMKDAPNSMWVTDNEGVGSFIQIDFKSQY
jgi:hypothetical protein